LKTTADVQMAVDNIPEPTMPPANAPLGPAGGAIGPEANPFGIKGATPTLPVPEVIKNEHLIARRSQAAAATTDGLIQGFLHRQGLKKGELDCLSGNAGQLAGQLVLASKSTVSIMEQAEKQQQHMSDMGLGMGGMGGMAMPGLPGVGGLSSLGVDTSSLPGFGESLHGKEGTRQTMLQMEDMLEAAGIPKPVLSKVATNRSELESLAAIAALLPENQNKTQANYTCTDNTWEVVATKPVNVRSNMTMQGKILKMKDPHCLVEGRVRNGWLDLIGDKGFMLQQLGNMTLLKKHTCGNETWTVAGAEPVHIRQNRSISSDILGVKDVGAIFVGRPTGETGEWVALLDEPGFVQRKLLSKFHEGNWTKFNKTLALFYESRRLQGMMGMGGMGMPGGGMGMMASAPALAIELGMSLKQMSKLSTDIVHKCVQSDAKHALHEVVEHMRSAEYVSEHLVANGPVIMSEMAAAVAAFRGADDHAFGVNLGLALRKVFLSHVDKSDLPEGPPDKYLLANVSAGMISGFFGKGSELDVKVNQHKHLIHVDLHQCVGDNLIFFQSAWEGIMFLMAQRVAGGPKEQAGKQKIMWGTALAFNMMQLPGAMRKCHVSEKEEEMLKDAVRSLGEGVKVHLKLPTATNSTNSTDEVNGAMEVTAKDWDKKDWYTFGTDLGKLLQKMATTQLSRKYIVDDYGVLRERAPATALAFVRRCMAAAPVSLVPLGLAALALGTLVVQAGRRMPREVRSFEFWSRSRQPEREDDADDAVGLVLGELGEDAAQHDGFA